MNKSFLLIAGYNYYPSGDTGDWKGCYATEEEALAQIGEPKYRLYKYNVCGEDVDWYKVVDLREWTN